MQQEPVVDHAITHIGIDDSARKLVIAILAPQAVEPVVFSIANERGAVRRFVKKTLKQTKGRVEACYEAGPLGFELQRWLEEEGMPCKVAAPSKTPRHSGAKIKTDCRDAKKLAGYLRSGNLTWVTPPSLEDEAARDVVRYLDAVRRDVARAWQRTGKFLLRHGRHFGGRERTQAHRRWLRQLQLEHPLLQQTFEMHLYAIDQSEARLKRSEDFLIELSGTERYAERVAWLSCFRGINAVIAMVILTELHGFERFKHPRQLMSFLGVVPTENSTGERRQLAPITKTGNSHVRWALVQMAKSLRHPPGRSRTIAARRKGQPTNVISIAERAELRGHEKYKRLRQRGKEWNKVTIALAREQVGFIWAVLNGVAN